MKSGGALHVAYIAIQVPVNSVKCCVVSIVRVTIVVYMQVVSFNTKFIPRYLVVK